MRPVAGLKDATKGMHQAAHRGNAIKQLWEALDPGPWPLKKNPYPVIIGKGA